MFPINNAELAATLFLATDGLVWVAAEHRWVLELDPRSIKFPTTNFQQVAEHCPDGSKGHCWISAALTRSALITRPKCSELKVYPHLSVIWIKQAILGSTRRVEPGSYIVVYSKTEKVRSGPPTIIRVRRRSKFDSKCMGVESLYTEAHQPPNPEIGTFKSYDLLSAQPPPYPAGIDVTHLFGCLGIMDPVGRMTGDWQVIEYPPPASAMGCGAHE